MWEFFRELLTFILWRILKKMDKELKAEIAGAVENVVNKRLEGVAKELEEIQKVIGRNIKDLNEKINRLDEKIGKLPKGA